MKEGKDWREEGRLGKWGEVRRKGKAPAGAGGTSYSACGGWFFIMV